MQTRYYDPEVGRFINADAFKYLGADGPIHGMNLYSYCGNNPVMKVDPTGTISKEWAWVVSGILIVGGIVLSVATAGLAALGVLGTLATVGGSIGGVGLEVCGSPCPSADSAYAICTTFSYPSTYKDIEGHAGHDYYQPSWYWDIDG